MTLETAREFLKLLASNTGLQTQFNTTSPEGPAAILRFARGKGFIFSEDDLRAALADYPEDNFVKTHLEREGREMPANGAQTAN